jgi:hypothetical protein
MEQENTELEIGQVQQKSQLNQVTPLSKYLAMVLFILLPFVGGWVGYTYAPEKVIEVEKVLPATSTDNINKLPSTADLQKKYLEGRSEGYEIEAMYTTTENDAQYFKLLKGTSACCGIYKYLLKTNSFHETGLRTDAVAGKTESPTGRYIVDVSYEKFIDVYDLETQSIEKDASVSEGETLVSATCGYGGYSYDLKWLDETTLQYGVYKSLEVEEGCPKMELIEHRTLKMK